MKILVFGAGVLGCNLARNFFRAGKDVTLLARGAWGESIPKNGLRIKDKFSPRMSVSRIPVVTELKAEDKYDVIFVVLRYTQFDAILDTVSAGDDLPEVLKWKDSYLSPKSFVLVLGESYTGPVTVNLAHIPHILLGGSTGSGKSVLLKLLLMQALRKGAEVYIADFKGGVDFPKVWHEKCRMCFAEEDLCNILDQLVEELERRKSAFKALGCPNIDAYPEMKIVGNAKTFTLIKQFFGTGALSEDRMLEVGERDTLSLGLHRLRFLLAPMVHWPEVMTAYEETEKILFSADAFGRFGSLERTARAPWVPQARRYYYNIIGKYGAQVQALLKKISALEIKTICPLHGPMLTEDLGEYLRLYDLWSQWKPEEPEGILIAHASIHGNTAHAAKTLKGKLEKKGVQVNICDLTVTDLSYAVASAFYCGKLVLASATYDGELFPPMREFLEHLRTKGFRNRRVGLIEDGSWAPAAARLMRTKLEEMKDIHLYETVVSLRGALNQTSEAQMDALVAELCAE